MPDDREAAVEEAWREYVNILRPYVFGEPPEQKLHEGRMGVEATVRAAGRAEVRDVVRWLVVVAEGGMCPHGNSAPFPTHAIWCDDCWNAARALLDEGGA